MSNPSHLQGEFDGGGISPAQQGRQRQLWEAYFRRSKNLFGTGPNDFARRCLSVIPKKGGRILDLGCGEGLDAVFFASHDYDVVGVDFSVTAARSAREDSRHLERRVQFVVADMSKGALPFVEKSFDVAFSHLGLHYFDDAKTTQVFAEIRRVLAPDGIFAFSVKSVHDPQYGQGTQIGRSMYLLDGHLRHFFDVHYVRRKIRSFQVLDIQETAGDFAGRRSCFIECICRRPAHRVRVP